MLTETSCEGSHPPAGLLAHGECHRPVDLRRNREAHVTEIIFGVAAVACPVALYALGVYAYRLLGIFR